MEFVL